jgi:hypothetical protein
MAVGAFSTFTGTSGVTTAAFAAGVHWPRPVLVIEADISNVGSAMTGFFRSNLNSSAGMHQVSLAQSRGVLNLEALLDPEFEISIPVHALPPIPSMPLPSLPAEHRMWVIPGYRDLRTVEGVQAVWNHLPALFPQLHDRGIDVLIDLGRLGRNDPRLPVVDAADQVVVLATTTMSDLNRLHKRFRLPDLQERIRGLGQSRYSLLLTDAPAEAVAPTEFGHAVLPVLGLLPFDPVGAAVFAHGREDPRPRHNRYRIGLRKAVLALTDRLPAPRAGADPELQRQVS